jgi:hypothetical protein
MNLEKLNVAELNAQEVQEIEGGLTGLELLAAAAAIYAVGQMADFALEHFLHGWNNPA